MFVTPKENPIFASLNSYYVNIERLIEHFQGEVGCGALSFKSSSSEGILFFDKDEILNGIFFQKNDELTGPEAVDFLIQASESTNFSLNVYLLRAEDIYFWSTMPNAQRLYQDLTTEFTDLEGLIKKMKSEGLTGFIEVVIGDAKGEGLIFFNNGQISGGSYSWGSGDSRRGEEDQEKLVQLTKDNGGAFHVSRIPMDEKNLAIETDEDLHPEEVFEKPSTRIITAMEEMMAIFERTLSAKKSIPSDFATVLNRKFVEKADRYPFLDPFAAEFKYANEKIKLEGDTTDEELTQGVVESIKELAAELDALTQFKSNLVTWMKKYSEEVKLFGITF
jgi:hypothetical protein